MLDIVKGLKDKQEQLERYMDKTTEIKKKPECFQMLKQAEKQYKIMIDMIAENSNKSFFLCLKMIAKAENKLAYLLTILIIMD